jgi:hypothetical protein
MRGHQRRQMCGRTPGRWNTQPDRNEIKSQAEADPPAAGRLLACTVRLASDVAGSLQVNPYRNEGTEGNRGIAP